MNRKEKREKKSPYARYQTTARILKLQSARHDQSSRDSLAKNYEKFWSLETPSDISPISAVILIVTVDGRI